MGRTKVTPTLSQLKRLLAAGTAKPWAATTRQGSRDWLIFAPGTPYEICQMFHDGTDGNEEGEANAELIVAAVNSLPGLIACAERLEAFVAHDSHPEACSYCNKLVAAAREALSLLGGKETK